MWLQASKKSWQGSLPSRCSCLQTQLQPSSHPLASQTETRSQCAHSQPRPLHLVHLHQNPQHHLQPSQVTQHLGRTLDSTLLSWMRMKIQS